MVHSSIHKMIQIEVTQRTRQWLCLQKWQHPREVEWYEELRCSAARGDVILPRPPALDDDDGGHATRLRWIDQLWCGAMCITDRGLAL